MQKQRIVLVIFVLFLSILLASCAGASGNGGATDAASASGAGSSGTMEGDPRQFSTDVLLYNGAGAAATDVNAFIDLLDAEDLSYKLINESELNEMSVDELAAFGMILWPGGYAGIASNNLSTATRRRVREAVKARGVSYAGFCAGSFMAVGPEDYGFAFLSSDAILPEYEPDGIHQHDYAEIEAFTMPGGSVQDLVWFGGPYFPSASEVLARYRDGTPAMMQTMAGKGFVVLSGPHPESPVGWADSDADRDGKTGDRTLARKLILSALRRQPLPTM
jgi:glutamine amidotransferase-like uncharacterized protein/predicted small secreted protein